MEFTYAAMKHAQWKRAEEKRQKAFATMPKAEKIAQYDAMLKASDRLPEWMQRQVAGALNKLREDLGK